VTDARHPYRLSAARQLATADPARHVADLVQLVLLTAANERLHHPDFGAGLGPSALFEPLDGALASVVELRARASLDRALGDRIDVRSVAVARVGETTIEANVEYRLRPGGDAESVAVRIDA
jgi:phage baseplate assembly protein W